MPLMQQRNMQGTLTFQVIVFQKKLGQAGNALDLKETSRLGFMDMNKLNHYMTITIK